MRQAKSKKMNTHPFLFAMIFVALTPSLLFAYEAAPYSETRSPTFITEKSAQLNGRVNPNEMPDTYEWFEWGISGRSEVYQTSRNSLRRRSTQVATDAKVVGLAPSTQYFYRQVSENSRGKSVGVTTYFTTKPLSSPLKPIAVITTSDAVFLSDTGATLRGYVSPHGNAKTRTWFEWGTTAKTENKTPEQGSGGDSATVSSKLSGLMPGSLYYFRAVAENEQGRTYGALRVFSTRGSSSVIFSEVPRDQYVPSPATPSDDPTTRTVTTSGEAAPQVEEGQLPQAKNRPGNFFGALFAPKKDVNTPTADGTDHVAVVVAADPFDSLWSMLSGKKEVEVAMQKVGPENVSAHTPVEYRIAYAYRRNTPATARLLITLPGEVIYIGDNTNNELLIEAGTGTERTYVLPLGRVENGSTRVISILGMTTGDAKGFPDALVRLEYTDESGTHIVGAMNGRLSGGEQNTANVASAKSTILPSSLFGWIIYVALVVGAVFLVRKARTEYTRRKKTLEKTLENENETNNDQTSQIPPFLPGAEEITPAVSA